MKVVWLVVAVFGGWQLWQFSTRPTAGPVRTASASVSPDSRHDGASGASGASSSSREPTSFSLEVPPTLEPEGEGCIPGLVGVCHREPAPSGAVTFVCLMPQDVAAHEAHGDEVRVAYAARCSQ